MSKVKLYLVVLGGRFRNCNVELHDVRWVASETIEAAIPELKSQWFGNQKGLHIDSYMNLEYVDGYKIVLKEASKLKPINKSSISCKNESLKKLWFVNLGGYKSDQLAEAHEFGMVVANSSKEAIKKAKVNWLPKYEKRHKDDLKIIETSYVADDNCRIESIGEWSVALQPDPLQRSQSYIPEWFGYWRLDK
ncbi:DUF1543 domain-containing protein [Prochlorococcus sp. MIT 1300]|uniref:DUF1543 domain-containing protein n=1 Tax=Prochlorococcus sp. MIT 1300 TaxID=3096218 RepID=UPI002A7566D5|nr:DUF1543 domain-containing protein [Prochlorococcus sp. MIT 1300]